MQLDTCYLDGCSFSSNVFGRTLRSWQQPPGASAWPFIVVPVSSRQRLLEEAGGCLRSETCAVLACTALWAGVYVCAGSPPVSPGRLRVGCPMCWCLQRKTKHKISRNVTSFHGQYLKVQISLCYSSFVHHILGNTVVWMSLLQLIHGKFNSYYEILRRGTFRRTLYSWMKRFTSRLMGYLSKELVVRTTLEYVSPGIRCPKSFLDFGDFLPAGKSWPHVVPQPWISQPSLTHTGVHCCYHIPCYCWVRCHCTDTSHFSHPLLVDVFFSFDFLAVRNNAAMNISSTCLRGGILI